MEQVTKRCSEWHRKWNTFKRFVMVATARLNVKNKNL